ncbi:MAG: hypothetical protein AAB370_07935 [Verrucomicrobiota bacterium]
MNDKPKSVWTRPWQGWRKVFIWFALVAVTIFVILLGLGLASAQNHNPAEHILPALGLALGVSLLVMVAVWFIRWLCCWRNFKKVLFGLACLITLIALFYAVENFRGKRAWEKYKLAGEANGERFDYASIVPPPVPDDQNFAMQPIWVEEISGIIGMEKARTWYGDKIAALGHTNPVRSLELSIELYGRQREQTNRTGNWQLAQKTDLAIWQAYYRNLATITNHFPVGVEPQKPAADVLLALSRYDAAIEQLRVASKLPHARFPVRYNEDNLANILLPHLACLKSITTALKLRAVAELQANQTEQALEDIKLMSRLHDAIRAEPILISHLVCIAMLNIQLQPIWEGLADHKWNEAQLIALDAELEKIDFLASYDFAMRAERAFGCGIVDYLRRNRREFASMGWDFDESNAPTQNHAQTFAAYAIPSGWFEQNKVSICQLHTGFFSPIINLQTRTYADPNVTDVKGIYREQLASSHPYNWFSRWLLPALQNASKKFVQGQAATDFARIAIALERHRLTHGQLPETLDALAPKFLAKLPHDIITGQPLKYRRMDDGNFILYSVGWNETDDGGTPALTKSGSADPQNGDWVWTSVAK